MDLHCPRCRAEYDWELPNGPSSAAVVQCSACEYVFLAGRAPALTGSTSGAASAPPDEPKKWQLRKADGRIEPIEDLAALRARIVAGSADRADEVSVNGHSFRRLDELPEFTSLFLSQLPLAASSRRSETSPAPAASSSPAEPPLPNKGTQGTAEKPPESDVAERWMREPPKKSPVGRLSPAPRRGNNWWRAVVVAAVAVAVFFVIGRGFREQTRPPPVEAVKGPSPSPVEQVQPLTLEELRALALATGNTAGPSGASPNPSPIDVAPSPEPSPNATEAPPAEANETELQPLPVPSVSPSVNGEEAKADAPESAGAGEGVAQAAAGRASPGEVADAGGAVAEGDGSNSPTGFVRRLPAGDARRERKYDELVTKADRLRAREQPERALDVYGLAHDVAPKRVEAVAGKGLALFDLGKYVQADFVLRDALKLNDRYSPAIMGMAETCRALGRNAEALKYYRQFVKYFPGNPDAEVARTHIERLKGVVER